jgi:putative copper resistance protein D
MLEVTLLSIILVWIHLIAATFWVGGMLFLSLVAVPLLKKAPDPVTAQRGFINLALRFRTLVWVALAILVVTGTILLPGQVNFSASFGEWPPAVLTKLSLVLLLVVVSLAHDQFIGPKVRILKHKPTSELTIVETILVRLSPLIGRLTMLLGLGVLLAAVFMVRS